MTKTIFINLPVGNLPNAKSFYEAVGATNNPQFTDDTAACMVISDAINVMLLTHMKWATFTNKPISDAHKTGEVMLALSCDSRDAVNAMADAAGQAGGTADCNPVQDHGFMFGRSFEDLDGHVWEAIWMDPKSMPVK